MTSDGQHYRAPRISGRWAARYLALQQQLRRQAQGSPRRDKTRRAMAQITAAVTDRRRDFAEKISTRLVSEHDLIVLEKLNTPGMVATIGVPAPAPGHGAHARISRQRPLAPREPARSAA